MLPDTTIEQLRAIKVADFPFEGKVVEVGSETMINDAFRLLNENNILSCPVYDEKAGKYLGFFDIVEAMALLYSLDAILDAIPASLMRDDAAKALEDADGSIGAGSPVSVIFEDSMGDLKPWQPVSADDTLDVVIARLATGLRRVPVVDSSGKVTKIISQSNVTEELAKILEKGGEKTDGIFTKSPATLEMGLTKVVSIREDEPAREAFKKIVETGHSAIGVVDEKNALFTCISTKDVRQFDSIEEAALQRVLARKTEESNRDPEAKAPDAQTLTRHVALFDLSASDFVSHARQAELAGKDRPSVICAQPDSSLRTIVGKLATAKVHRVFLCDAKRSPVGVVSVSDICKLLAEGSEESKSAS